MKAKIKRRKKGKNKEKNEKKSIRKFGREFKSIVFARRGRERGGKNHCFAGKRKKRKRKRKSERIFVLPAQTVRILYNNQRNMQK